MNIASSQEEGRKIGTVPVNSRSSCHLSGTARRFRGFSKPKPRQQHQTPLHGRRIRGEELREWGNLSRISLQSLPRLKRSAGRGELESCPKILEIWVHQRRDPISFDSFLPQLPTLGGYFGLLTEYTRNSLEPTSFRTFEISRSVIYFATNCSTALFREKRSGVDPQGQMCSAVFGIGSFSGGQLVDFRNPPGKTSGRESPNGLGRGTTPRVWSGPRRHTTQGQLERHLW